MPHKYTLHMLWQITCPPVSTSVAVQLHCLVSVSQRLYFLFYASVMLSLLVLCTFEVLDDSIVNEGQAFELLI